MHATDLPLLNAGLNATSAVMLSAGYACIRSRRIAAHKLCMLTAFAASAVFLASYLVYHYHVGSVRFPGAGGIRYVYFAILISHVVLAVAMLPFVARTLWFGLGGRYDRHVQVARYTLPVWLYVSVTGIVVYVMLYRMRW